MTEFGGAPGRYCTMKAILLINFCLPEVNKSPWDTAIAKAELAGRNRTAHSATLEFAAEGDSKNLSSPVIQRRNDTARSNECSVGY